MFFSKLGMRNPWKKFGQKIKNFEIFFDIIDFHACLYMHVKFHQNRSKFGSVITRFSKMPHHGISIFANFHHLRVIFEWGIMFFLLSFFLPYVHLRLTVPTLFFYLSKETIALSKNMLQRWQSTIVPPKLPLRKVAKIDNSNFLAMSTLKCLVFLRPH